MEHARARRFVGGRAKNQTVFVNGRGEAPHLISRFSSWGGGVKFFSSERALFLFSQILMMSRNGLCIMLELGGGDWAIDSYDPFFFFLSSSFLILSYPGLSGGGQS